jgi:hypothetical protein
MDRRYYGLKALVIVVALGIAFMGSGFGTPRLSREPVQDSHYQAATLMQATILDTGSQFGHMLTRLLCAAGLHG